MPYFYSRTFRTFVREVDLSVLAKTALSLRNDPFDATSIIEAATGYDCATYACKECNGDERPCIQIDGEWTCLVCQKTVLRTFTVTMTFSGTVTVEVEAADEDDAGEKAQEKADDGDVDFTDCDDITWNVDHATPSAW